MIPKTNQLVLIFIFSCLFLQCGTTRPSEYEDFLTRLKNDEPYIQFFSTEKSCISITTEEYFQARKEFFSKVSKEKDEPDDAIESFMEFCKTKSILNEGCEEKWEKVLTVLSYELYANMPIFEYSASNINEYRDIIYAKYPNKKLSLDLFIPKEPVMEPIPCIVAIHGGGWVVNRRIWFEPFAKYLASKGLAAVTIDYRKLPGVKIMDIIHDSKAAVRWVRANAEKYGIDPNSIGAIGASAGGHLVTLLGTTPNDPKLEGSGGNSQVSSAVQAVVGIATPAFNLEKESRLNKRLGVSKNELKVISPYENIDAKSAPLYLIHGTEDRVVPADNSQDLYDKYLAVGAHVELTWIEGEGHGFYEGNDRAIKMAAEFFLKQFSTGE
ncbi:MAG: alpha/beta hydrolase [Candidatus Neomarinimicrobiota bacterium]